jgi:Zn-dependent protease
MVAWLFSASVHETGHAWVSSLFGDDLARSQGRVTLNPAAHIDPIGTLLFPAMGFFTGGTFLGWAKPVPVNPLRWRNKRMANFWVSIAGIIGNLIIAFCAALIVRVLVATDILMRDGVMHISPVGESSAIEAIARLLSILISLNIGLGIFNLFPIPPLDGGTILSSILPDSFESGLDALNQFGFILLIVALYTGVVGSVMYFIVPPVYRFLLYGIPITLG